MYPYRPAVGRPAPCRPPAGGRDLNVNKIYIYSHFGPWGEPAAPLPGGRYLPPTGGAVGGYLPPGRGAAGSPPSI